MSASRRRTSDLSSEQLDRFRLQHVSWEVRPEPASAERRALLAAVEQALAAEESEPLAAGSAWWRSGFDALGGGPAPQEAWRESGVIEA
jgi:hypothetical protein